MNIGIVGAGAISGIYLQNMTRRFPDLRVRAVCAAHLESAQKKADEYHLAAVTFEEMLSDPEIGLIVILTPVGTHYELIRRGLLAGKHVYTEKTIAQSSAEAAELLALARSRGLYLGCAPDTFLGSSIQTAKHALEESMIGNVHSFSISVNRCNDLLTALFPFLRLPGAGALRDYLVYYVTALVSLLGPVDTVSAFVETPYPVRYGKFERFDNYRKRTETPNESVIAATVRMRSGIVGTIHENNESNLEERSDFALFGTSGILLLGNPNNFGDPVRYLAPLPGAENPSRDLEPVSSYSDNCRGLGVAEMVSAIAAGRAARASGDMGRHVLEVLEAMETSAAEERFVKVRSDFSLPPLFTAL